MILKHISYIRNHIVLKFAMTKNQNNNYEKDNIAIPSNVAE